MFLFVLHSLSNSVTSVFLFYFRSSLHNIVKYILIQCYKMQNHCLIFWKILHICSFYLIRRLPEINNCVSLSVCSCLHHSYRKFVLVVLSHGNDIICYLKKRYASKKQSLLFDLFKAFD